VKYLSKITVIAVWLLMLKSGLAFSHEIRPAYLEINEAANHTYKVIWKVPAKNEYKLNLGLKLPDGVDVKTMPIKSYAQGFYIEQFSFTLDSGLAGKQISFENLQSTFIEVLARVSLIGVNPQVTRVMPDSPTFVVEKDASFFGNLLTYGNLGISHILIGLDHLLFILCLMMITGFSRKLLIAITGFTVAHSLTLILTTLDVLRLNVAVVEAIIALSIVLLVLELCKGRRDTLTWRYPVFVSSLFGLLHGCGFASVLSEIGVPEHSKVSSLLSFNLGVEIGQILFIVTCFAVTKVAVKFVNRSIYQFYSFIFIYAIGVLSTYWLIDRSMGILLN
jgi:hydrogenase/urease accessory protein HupE